MSGSGGPSGPENVGSSDVAAVEAVAGFSEEENAGNTGDRSYDAGGENGGEAPIVPDGDDREAERERAREEQGGRGPEESVGGSEAGFEPLGVDQAGHGLVATSAAVCVVIGALELFPSEQGVRRVFILLSGYPFVTGLFYLVYRRWGRWLGAPPRVGGACMLLALLAWFLLFSDQTTLQRIAFWLGQTALLGCGVSLGGWLAVVAYRNDTGMWKALCVAVRADGWRNHPVWQREPRQ